MDINKLLDPLYQNGVALGKNLILALLALIVGRWLIGVVGKAINVAMTRRSVDVTLAKYAVSVIGGILNIVLVISILGILGIQTTSFAALLAAAGLAVGTAMSGLLANFAAGVFLQVLRPFKVGDMITAGGTTGVVHEIGLFVTGVDTPDNVRTYIGNAKLFSDNIQNYNTNAYRRVDLVRHFGAGTDMSQVAADLKARLSAIPHVLAEPAPDVEILEFRPGGPLLAIRPYCHNDNYWQVYFDSNEAIETYCQEKRLPAPEQVYAIRQA
ncbi:MAG: mechanosensitive ion channel family protein [Armatimonas sp.]